MPIPQHHSIRNSFIARRGRRCTCRPYVEILARGEWLRQHMMPKAKAKPTLIRVWLPFTRVDRAGSRFARTTRMVTAQLFCLCQVEPIEKQTGRRAA